MREPAFPRAVSMLRSGSYFKVDSSDGMSLRDYFAAKAMQAMVNGVIAGGGDYREPFVAEQAYKMADAMVEERQK